MELPTAIDVSSVMGLVAVSMLTAQILLGLLLSVGYNPLRQFPNRRLKLFTLHNWLGYIGLATAVLHAAILLVAKVPMKPEGFRTFRVYDILVPIESPVQPIPTTLGAIALYLVAFVVLTSYFRTVFGRHRWKQLHYVAYAAASVFYVHGTWADPLLQNRFPDFIDAEKAYVEGLGLLVVAATIWRFRYGQSRRANPAPAR